METPTPPRQRAPGSFGDAGLEALVLLGFIGLLFFLANYAAPKENEFLLAQGVGALTVIATLVAKSLWERRGETAAANEVSMTRAETTRDAVSKISPAGTADTIDPGAASTPPAVEDPALPDYARGGA